MSDTGHIGGIGDPFEPLPTARRSSAHRDSGLPGSASPRYDLAPDDGLAPPWQSTAIKLITIVAVWLGY